MKRGPRATRVATVQQPKPRTPLGRSGLVVLVFMPRDSAVPRSICDYWPNLPRKARAPTLSTARPVQRLSTTIWPPLMTTQG